LACDLSALAGPWAVYAKAERYAIRRVKAVIRVICNNDTRRDSARGIFEVQNDHYATAGTPLPFFVPVLPHLRLAILSFDNFSTSINACVLLEAFRLVDSVPEVAVSILPSVSGFASAWQCATTIFSTIDSSGVSAANLKR
jgi:hypothetical protein